MTDVKESECKYECKRKMSAEERDGLKFCSVATRLKNIFQSELWKRCGRNKSLKLAILLAYLIVKVELEFPLCHGLLYPLAVGRVARWSGAPRTLVDEAAYLISGSPRVLLASTEAVHRHGPPYRPLCPRADKPSPKSQSRTTASPPTENQHRPRPDKTIVLSPSTKSATTAALHVAASPSPGPHRSVHGLRVTASSRGHIVSCCRQGRDDSARGKRRVRGRGRWEERLRQKCDEEAEKAEGAARPRPRLRGSAERTDDAWSGAWSAGDWRCASVRFLVGGRNVQSLAEDSAGRSSRTICTAVAERAGGASERADEAP
jgi:hypothetical protein